jgi:DNA-binding PadR family transcriptional regulator
MNERPWNLSNVLIGMSFVIICLVATFIVDARMKRLQDDQGRIERYFHDILKVNPAQIMDELHKMQLDIKEIKSIELQVMKTDIQEIKSRELTKVKDDIEILKNKINMENNNE